MAALPLAAWPYSKAGPRLLVRLDLLLNSLLPAYLTHLSYLMPDITTTELKQRLQAGETPHIIDVRETWEVEESRIPGSQNIPLGTLPTKLDDLEDLKDQEVIVHCKSGARSASAKAFLTQQGFTNVRNLEGGMMAYANG